MQPRTETYSLKDGTGRIEVRGSHWASGLFLDGKPFVFNFYDCEGSIGQDLYRFTQPPDGEQYPDLRDTTANLPPKRAYLPQLVLPMLRQFASGDYTLTLAPLTEDETWIEYNLPDHASRVGYTIAGYYPYEGTTLIATQPVEELSDDRIAYFWYAIEEGARPFAITASVEGSWCEFVLDGHHKLMAYAYAGLKPWRLCISRSSPPLAESDWPAHIVGSPFSWRRVHDWQRRQNR